MNKLTPEELQRIAENAEAAGAAEASTGATDLGGQEKELEEYTLLMRLLDKGPDIGLRYDFTAKLNRRIRAAEDRQIGLKWYGFAAALVGVGFGVSFVSMAVFDVKAARGFIEVADRYKWVLGFVVTGFLGVQYFDRRVRHLTP